MRVEMAEQSKVHVCVVQLKATVGRKPCKQKLVVQSTKITVEQKLCFPIALDTLFLFHNPCISLEKD